MGETRRKKEKLKTNHYQIKKSKRKERKKHPKLKKAILIFLITIILLILTAIGVVAGIFFSDKWKIEKEDLMITEQNSSVYDAEGNYLGQLVGNENRIIIPLSEMGEYIPKAFVAIEDERFDEHSGIDLKRTLGATIQYVLHRGSSSYGGSTITQQLVKNMMQDKDDTGFAGIERKIREMSRAYQIEQMLSKNQIIELYLNEIFMGGTVHGVESASQYYFAKSAKELTLAQSAFLAGINDGPNLYNPYGEEDHTERITRRTKTVLAKMKELGKISEEEYNEAIAEVEKGFNFKKGETSQASNLPFLAVEAISEAASDLAELKDVDYKTAYAMIKSGGYKLYTTLQPDIQKAVNEEFTKTTYVTTKTETVKDGDGNSKQVTYQTQAGMAVIDYKTGKVVAIGGALGTEQNTAGLDHATGISRQPGSSIKPLANIAPGLQEGVITAATVYDDSYTYFGGGTYHPQNSTGYQGLCTVRRAIAISSNVVNVKILSNVGLNTAIKYLNNFGLTNYNDEDKSLPLAIGGTTHGTSPLQMAAAYGAIANKGEYIEPTFYVRLEDSDSKTILEPKQEKRRVISEGNAYILSSILKSPVTEGTAWRCAISGMDVAAKTGTAEGAKDKWLCGFTPYYSAAVWYGYSDIEYKVTYEYAAQLIWKSVMTDIHRNLKNATFQRPSNIVTATICKTSGKLATSECKDTYAEYFVKGTVPGKCDGHVTVKLCKESGKVATEYCTEVEEKVYTARPDKENNASWKTTGSEKYDIPKDTCTIHTAETSKIIVPNVVGKTEEEAKVALAGLNIQVIYEHNSAIANGAVIRQSLAPETKVDKGVAIVITINKISGNTETPEKNEQVPPANTTIQGNTENQNTNTTTPENTEIPNTNTQTGTNTEKPASTNPTTPAETTNMATPAQNTTP